MSTAPGGSPEAPQPESQEALIQKLTTNSDFLGGTPKIEGLGIRPTDNADQLAASQRTVGESIAERPTSGKLFNDADVLLGRPPSFEGLMEKSTNEAGELQPKSKDNIEDLREKPTNDYDRLNTYFESLSPDRRAEIAQAAREGIKVALDVKDTADLSGEARKVFDAYSDWLMGKVVLK